MFTKNEIAALQTRPSLVKRIAKNHVTHVVVAAVAIDVLTEVAIRKIAA